VLSVHSRACRVKEIEKHNSDIKTNFDSML